MRNCSYSVTLLADGQTVDDCIKVKVRVDKHPMISPTLCFLWFVLVVLPPLLLVLLVEPHVGISKLNSFNIHPAFLVMPGPLAALWLTL